MKDVIYSTEDILDNDVNNPSIEPKCPYSYDDYDDDYEEELIKDKEDEA